jgi:hypothetical protein
MFLKQVALTLSRTPATPIINFRKPAESETTDVEPKVLVLTREGWPPGAIQERLRSVCGFCTNGSHR